MARKKEKRIVEEVLDTYKDLKNLSTERIQRYDENLRWFKGDKDIAYPSGRSDHQSAVIANIIESNIRTITAVLTDSKPIMRVKAFPLITLEDQQEEMIAKFSEANDNVLHHVWRINDLHDHIRQDVLNGCLTGLMCERMFWDSSKYGGLGEIGAEVIHPRYIFFDPKVPKIDLEDGSCDWFIYAILKPLTWFHYYFPNVDVKTVSKAELRKEYDEETNIDMGLYIEAYKSEYEIEEEKTEISGKEIKKRRARYPKGRRIIIGTDKVLDDSVIDVFPFSIEPIADEPENLWGTDDVRRQIELQREFNLKLSQLSQNIALVSNRQAVASESCGLDPDIYAENADRPGMLFVLDYGKDLDDFHKGFEVIQNANVQPELFQFVYTVMELMEKVTGVTKLIQGLSSKRERQTGFEVGKMLETATIRLRERASHIEDFIRKIGLIIMQYVAKYYREPRPVWSIDKETGQMLISRYEFPKHRNRITGEEEPIDWEYDIEVQPDSTLPIDLNSLANLAIRLKERQVITNKELLKRLQLSNWQPAPDQTAAPEAQKPPMPAPTGMI